MALQEDFEIAAGLAHRRVLRTLEEKVTPAHTALLVIDMQNDFCAAGGLVSKDGRDLSEAQRMAERLPAFIAGAREAGVLPIFIRCVYSTQGNPYLSDVWLEQAARERKGGYTRIPVCGEGTWEGDWYGGVRPAAGDVIVSKHRYDAFQGTDLDLVLRSHGIRTVVITGVVTNVCVETTARASFVRDYYTVVVEDGCAAYHRADHEQTLSNIRRFFGVTPSMGELSALWHVASAKMPAPRKEQVS